VPAAALQINLRPEEKNGDSFPDGEKAPVFFSAEELFLPCEEKVRLFFPCGVIGNWLLIFFSDLSCTTEVFDDGESI